MSWRFRWDFSTKNGDLLGFRWDFSKKNDDSDWWWLEPWNGSWLSHQIGNKNPNWLICFRGVAQPPTSDFMVIQWELKGFPMVLFKISKKKSDVWYFFVTSGPMMGFHWWFHGDVTDFTGKIPDFRGSKHDFMRIFRSWRKILVTWWDFSPRIVFLYVFLMGFKQQKLWFIEWYFIIWCDSMVFKGAECVLKMNKSNLS